MIFITSDMHFYHQKEFIYKARGFDCVEEMNEQIIENWNKVVTSEDDVYVLGDCMLGSDYDGAHLMRLLKGNLHIIYGNHDTDNRKIFYKNLPNVVECCYATVIKYNRYRFYLSHYPTLTANYDDDRLRNVTINLCGHSHTTDPFIDWDAGLGLIYHCEMDAHNCTPISIEYVIAQCREKLKNK